MVLVWAIALSASAQNVITTVAGAPGSFPRDPISATQAPLGRIDGVAVDRSGNIYASDLDNQIVVRIGTDGVTQVVAGNGIAGYSGDNGPAIDASLNSPGNLAIDAHNSLFIADISNGRIRKVDSAGVISTLAVLPLSGQIAIDSAGNVYCSAPNTVSRVDPSGTVTLFAGGGANSTWQDGDRAIDAKFDSVYGVAADGAGNVFISLGAFSNGSGRTGVARVAPDGTITLAFAGVIGFGMAADAAGNVYLPVLNANQIIRISAAASFFGLRFSSVYAGTGQQGFAGDGSAASQALLRLQISELNAFNPSVLGLSVDSLGNLYFGDLGNHRLRRVGTDGIIGTTAGNGKLKFGGDGGQGISAQLDLPTDLAVDERGNLYVVDFNNQRIRRVDASGTITTFAGGGNAGPNGVPAVSANVAANAVALDRTANLLIVTSNAVRRVTPDGMIRNFAGTGAYPADGTPCATEVPAISTPLGNIGGIAVGADDTVYYSVPTCASVFAISTDGMIHRYAGSGSFGNTVDGSAAIRASLGNPTRLALDRAGNLYIADVVPPQKILRVTKDGIIHIYAGGGSGLARTPEGGPAVGSVISNPGGMAVDNSGNLLFVNIRQQKVHLVTPDQRIYTFAGTGQKGFGGDGGPATQALLAFSPGGNVIGFGGVADAGVALDSNGNLYIADAANDRVRVVAAQRPAVSANLQNLSFAGQSQGAPAPAQQILISGAISGLSFQVSAVTADGGDWLQANPSAGSSPRLIDVTANPFNLNQGSYRGSIVIDVPNGNPQQMVIPVDFAVGAASSPQLSVDTNELSFPFPRNSPPRAQSISVSNAGSGKLDFEVSIQPDAARAFLKITAASGSANPGTPVSIRIIADPTGLAPGTYTGQIVISAHTSDVRAIPVVMTVSTSDRALLLSQSGLSFTAIAGGGTPPPQNLGVLNLGTGVSGLSVNTSTLGGGTWLRAALASSDQIQTVDVTSDATGLSPGRYYGLVKISSAAAANSPQVATGLLDVLAAGTDLGAILQPNEFLFAALAGGSSPGSRDVLVYNLTASPKPFRVSSSDSWLAAAPTSGTAMPNHPARLVVQPFTDNLAAGTYRGTVTLQFDDGRVRIIDVTVVVTSTAAVSSVRNGPRVAAACQPTKLFPAITSLGNDFSVPGGWPVALQVQVQDDCGTPLESGSVVAEFSNGDPPISLTSLKLGRWDGTWQNRRSQAGVTITVKAATSDRQIAGLKQVSGGFGANRQPPVIAIGGIADAASRTAFRPLSPGTLVTISGDRLSDETVLAPAVPFATNLANTSVLIAGQLLPIASTEPGQITAIIPYGIEANTSQQILVQRGDTYSQPVSVNLAASSPAIFTKGGTQGMILDANGNLVAPGNAAKAGDTVTIYCTGLGALQSAVNAGDYGPSSSATSNRVAVSIGSQDATVTFSGLAPTLIGLYFVQAIVPDGIDANDQAPVTITSLTTPPAVSQTVTIAIQQ